MKLTYVDFIDMCDLIDRIDEHNFDQCDPWDSDNFLHNGRAWQYAVNRQGVGDLRLMKGMEEEAIVRSINNDMDDDIHYLMDIIQEDRSTAND